MLLLLSLAPGCAHNQLRYNSVKTAETVADVHTQQVLDNLAKFANNRHALPHFSYPNQGGSSVVDTAGGDTALSFSPFALAEWGFGLDASRTNNESYTMTPINDAQKLEVMRCAYQRAISGCCGFGESASCPDCEKRYSAYYLGSSDPGKTGEVNAAGDAVYEVKPRVALIYYPSDELGDYRQAPTPNGATHVAVSTRDDSNRVGYRYVKTEYDSPNSGPATLFAAGASLYKLARYDLGSEEDNIEIEIAKIIELADDGAIDPKGLRLQAGALYDLEKLVCKYQQLRKEELPEPPLGFGLTHQQAETSRDSRLAKLPRDDGMIMKLFEGSSPRLSPNAEARSIPEQLVHYKRRLYCVTKADLKEMQADQPPLVITKALPQEVVDAFFGELSKTEKQNRSVALRMPVPLEPKTDLKRRYVENTLAEQTRRSGEVTPACLGGECWFGVGRRCDVPHDCPCNYVGHHCGTYVWVPPCGRDQLTRLTLTVLDIATSDAAKRPTTEVYAFIDKDGKTATSYEEAAYIARADLPRGGSYAGLLPASVKYTAPANGDETRAIKTLRDEARLAFKRRLVREAGVDLFAMIRQSMGEATEGKDEGNTVEFVTDEYREATLTLTDGDQLVALAARILADNSLLADVRPIDGDGTEAALKDFKGQIINDARALLTAELRVQSVPTETVLPNNGAMPPERRPSGLGIQGVPALQRTLTLDFLGNL